MRETLDSLKSMKKDTVLEVACGSAYLSEFLLYEQFHEIHMFDQDPKAIDKAKIKFKDKPKASSITSKTMQSFEWDQ